MSFSLTLAPLSRYSESPERYRRRVRRTSRKSTGRLLSALSRISDTSAIPSGWREAEPAKITSSGLRARTALADCSPSTQRTASATFDLPEPLGPTISTMPGGSSATVRLANDLKPTNSRRLRNNGLFVVGGYVELLQGRVGRGLLGCPLRVAAAARDHLRADAHFDGKLRRVARPR